MPILHWEWRKSSPHYYFHSFERFEIAEMIKDFELLLLLLFSAEEEATDGRFLLMCLTSLTMLHLQDDFQLLRPSNMYPPAGFYPSGSYDPFWTEPNHYDLFKHKFRFRLEHFHVMLKAMDLEDKFFRVGAEKKKNKYRADVCLLVVLRRLSFPVCFFDRIVM